MPASIDPANAIILLALLDEAPRTGYDLKQAVDERLQRLVEITAGTVYYTLKKLETRGWAKGSLSRTGRRPERRTYKVTAEGRRGLARLLEEASLQADRPYSPFDLALYFAPYLPPRALLKAVGRRLADLQARRTHLQAIEEKNPGRWPFHLYYLREKTRELMDLEERWCQRIKRKVQEKTFERV